MKFRVIDLESGDVCEPASGHDFILFDDGSLGELDRHGEDVGGILACLSSYALEFAFAKDGQGEWIWEHSVLSD